MSSSSANPVTRYLQLGLCVGGIYTCYLLYGVLQERLYQEQPDGTVFAATVSGVEPCYWLSASGPCREQRRTVLLSMLCPRSLSGLLAHGAMFL